MLTDRAAFAAQLGALAKYHTHQLSAGDVDLYWSLLRDKLTDDGFAAACERLEGAEWWPSPARLLRAAKSHAPRDDGHAVELYHRVTRCQEWDAEIGTVYSVAGVRAYLGAFAASVFLAAGGPLAFRSALLNEHDEPFVRKAFLAAYWSMLDDPQRAVEGAERVARLMPGTPNALVRDLSAKMGAP